MNSSIRMKNRSLFWLLLPVGAAAGFLGGFFGAGGGIVLLYFFHCINRDRSAHGVRDNFASTIACVLPVSAISSLLYAHDGAFTLASLMPLLFPAITGGVLGAILLSRINTEILKKLFAAFVLLGGIRMILD